MKLFTRKKPISGSNLFAWTLLLTLSSFHSFGQGTNLSVYDENMDTVSFAKLEHDSPYIVLTTQKSCIGCVEYLFNENVSNTVIYLIDNVSISQARQVTSKNCSHCHNYYVMAKSNFLGVTPDMRGPLLVDSSTGKVVPYNELSLLTQDFSLSGKEIRKMLHGFSL